MDECGYDAIWTRGRTIFGVGRGHHSREVETSGAPILDQEANRELFEEQGGLQHVNMSISMDTPKPVMLEQLRWFPGEVMPKFA